MGGIELSVDGIGGNGAGILSDIEGILESVDALNCCVPGAPGLDFFFRLPNNSNFIPIIITLFYRTGIFTRTNTVRY